MGSAVVREWVGVIAGCKPGTCGVGAQADRPPVGPTVAGPGFGMGSGAGMAPAQARSVMTVSYLAGTGDGS
jgi:hypothetical protein